MNIVISGTVGVGKTTVIDEIKKIISQDATKTSIFHREKIGDDNPFLTYYYKDIYNWSFLIQINFLLDRFKNTLNSSFNTYDFSFYDRHFLDDYIWTHFENVKYSLTQFQMNTYNILNSHLTKKLNERSKVEYFFLLQADFNTVIERIKNRNRKEEQEVDVTYWRNLYKIYYKDIEIQNYLKENAKHLVIIDTNNKTPTEIAKLILNIINK